MALSIDDLFTPLSPDDVLSAMLAIGTALGLDVTAWQPGQPNRTILKIDAQKISDVTAIIATMNKAGFLDYAAQVTPEGGPGWLDILALSVYNETRVQARQALTSLTFTCVGATGTSFPAGQLHATTPNGKTYSNVAVVTIVTSGTFPADFIADVAGAASSAGTNELNKLVTPLVGVSVTNGAPAVGSDAESNAQLVSRCRAKLAAISQEGPKGAYEYAARTINGENQVAVSSGPSTQPANPATRATTITDNATGIVTTYVASANGAYLTPPNHTGDAAKAIEEIDSSGPLLLVQVTGHGYVTNDQVQITQVSPGVGANGVWTITVVDADTFTLNGSAWTVDAGPGGFSTRYSDLDLIDKSVQANAVPDAVTSTVLSANAITVPVQGVITVTGASKNLNDSVIVANAQAALARLAAITPIGGIGLANQLYLDQIRNAVMDATPSTVSVSLSLPAGNVTVAIGGVIEFLPTPVFTVARV